MRILLIAQGIANSVIPNYGAFMANVAQRVVDHFGGEKPLASALGVSVATPYSWRYDRSAGGGAGLVPAKHHQPLLDISVAIGKPLPLTVFFDSVPAEVARATIEALAALAFPRAAE